MQLQRNLNIALITFLSVAAIPFAPKFLALFPTPPALAQTTDTTHTAEAERLLQQASQQYQTSQFQAALQSLQQALTIYQQIGDKAEEGATLGNIGLVYGGLGQYANALKYYQQALVIFKQVSDKTGEGETLNNLGAVYSGLGQYTDALKYYQQALMITKQVGNKAGEGIILNNFGLVYEILGQYADALKYYQQALVIHQQVGNKLMEGTALNNLGEVYLKLGQYADALKYYQQGLTITKVSLVGIGLVYSRLGQYADALKYYQQALTITKQVSNKAMEGASLVGIGQVYSSLGQYANALKYYQQGLTIIKQVGEKTGEGETLNNLGAVYSRLGQYTDALKYYQQALDIHKQIGNKADEGITLNNLGQVYSGLGQYTDALKYYQQALVITKQVGNKAGEGTILNNLGAVYSRLGQYADSLKYYQQALVIHHQVGNKVGRGETFSNLGSVYHQQGQYADAETTLIAAIQVWESLRPGLTDADKVLIFETQAGTYRFLQQALVAQKKTDKALEIAERSKARAFVELLSSRQSNSQPTVTIPPPTIQQIKQIAKQQNATLVEYSITYNVSRIQGKEQWLTELFIWVVKPTGEVTFRSVDLKNLDANLASIAEETRVAAATGRNRVAGKQNAILSNLVRGTRDSISKAGSNTATNSAAGEAISTPRINSRHLQQMHQLLIQPIADLLPTAPDARVIFIPHESLFLVPFPALQDANGKYLIEKHTVLTAPAIQVLELTQHQRQNASGKELLVVGNPTMPSISPTIGEPPQKLDSLPGAEQEAIDIARLLNTKAVTGDQATEAAIKQQMPQARIIHLATHGLLDDSTGEGVPGAIALAPSAKDDGLLTANEILDLKLNAELVVLSACDTGRGIITGDGVIGLSRSLITAGVPSVVVSLWLVPDESTASLMTEFYRQLQQNPDKAVALRQAMLTTMKKHPHPRDWAAFTLIGEAN
jgi:CHAT domain-containing protein